MTTFINNNMAMWLVKALCSQQFTCMAMPKLVSEHLINSCYKAIHSLILRYKFMYKLPRQITTEQVYAYHWCVCVCVRVHMWVLCACLLSVCAHDVHTSVSMCLCRRPVRLAWFKNSSKMNLFLHKLCNVLLYWLSNPVSCVLAVELIH